MVRQNQLAFTGMNVSKTCESFPLSLGERAGVRANHLYSHCIDTA